MRLLELSLPTPAQDLALDEALLESAEAADPAGEVMRLWEPAAPMVVVGCSSRVGEEVNLAACRERNIPILRRPSGGAAIVAGPGCLMYSIVLSLAERPQLRGIDLAHRHVLDRLVAAIAPLVDGVARRGTSDVAVRDRKFSGNSLRVKRDHLLYHGTILYDFSLELIASCLRTPPRQPDYRQGREHESFVMNLPVEADVLRAALKNVWRVDEATSRWPRDRVAELVAEKYTQAAWNERR